MSATTNLGLIKPDYNQDADVDAMNDNMDVIDQFAGSTNQAIGNLANLTTTEKGSLVGAANELNSKIGANNQGACASLSSIENAINTVLNNMNNGESRNISFTVTGSISGFDQTLYIGTVYKINDTRAWVNLNTAFGYHTVGTRNSTWTWRRVTETAI